MRQDAVTDPTHLCQTLRIADDAVRPGFGVREVELGPEQIMPWHLHSVIFGELRLRLNEPKEALHLKPTEPCNVVAEHPHQVKNAGDTPVTFLMLQRAGAYDYVPLDP